MEKQNANPRILAVNPLNIRCERSNYFGQALKEVRLEKGLTQEESASLSQMTQKMWSSYELGKSRPNLDTIILIAKGLEINPFDLISRSLMKSKYFTDYSQDTKDNTVFKKKNRKIEEPVFA